MVRWDLIAYLVRYAVPQLESVHKTEAEKLLPYLALGLLRYEEFGWVNPLAERRTRRHAVVIDIGAFDGEFAKEVLRTMSFSHSRRSANRGKPPELQIVAVEPNPFEFSKLQERASAESWGDRLCSLQIALSDNSARAVRYLAVGEAATRGHRMLSHLLRLNEVASEEFEQEVIVEQATLDELFKDRRCNLQSSEEVYLLKVDTEGHDSRVLWGGMELLQAKRVKYLLFELMDSENQEDLDKVLAKLWDLGYGCFLVMDRFLVPVNGGWFHPAYRTYAHAGAVHNVDVLCAQPHDQDLRALVEGYVTHSHATRAREIVWHAIEAWRESVKKSTATVTDHYDMKLLTSIRTNDEAARAVFVGDLLRHGHGMSSSSDEMAQARKWYELATTLPGSKWPSQMAMVELGTCFHFGECAPIDLRKAIEWYTRAMPDQLVAWHLLRLAAMQMNASFANVIKENTVQ